MSFTSITKMRLTDWYTVLNNTENTFRCVAYSPTLNIFVVAPYNSTDFLYSYDMINWIQGTTDLSPSRSFEFVKWIKELNMFIAVKHYHSSDVNNDRRIAISYDGKHWTHLNYSSNFSITSLVWASHLNKVITCGTSTTDTRFLHSSDGLNWTEHSPVGTTTTWFRDIAYSPKLNLLATASANLSVSTDGINWIDNQRPAGVSQTFYAIDWSPCLGMFVACVGNDSTISVIKLVYSYNGYDWYAAIITHYFMDIFMMYNG